MPAEPLLLAVDDGADVREIAGARTLISDGRVIRGGIVTGLRVGGRRAEVSG